MSGRGPYQHCNCASFLGGGDVSWILNKVVVAQVAKGSMALTVYRPIGLAYVSQGGGDNNVSCTTGGIDRCRQYGQRRLLRGNACRPSINNFLSSRLLSTNI